MSDTPIPNPREITPERLAEIRRVYGHPSVIWSPVIRDLCDALAESWAKANRLRGENDRLVARIKELEEVNNDLNIFRAKHLPGGYVEA